LERGKRRRRGRVAAGEGGETSVAASRAEGRILPNHPINDGAWVIEDGEGEGDGVLSGRREQHALRSVEASLLC